MDLKISPVAVSLIGLLAVSCSSAPSRIEVAGDVPGETLVTGTIDVYEPAPLKVRTEYQNKQTYRMLKEASPLLKTDECKSYFQAGNPDFIDPSKKDDILSKSQSCYGTQGQGIVWINISASRFFNDMVDKGQVKYVEPHYRSIVPNLDVESPWDFSKIVCLRNDVPSSSVVKYVLQNNNSYEAYYPKTDRNASFNVTKFVFLSEELSPSWSPDYRLMYKVCQSIFA